MKKLLRTIRFDETDARVYARAAAPGAWAVSGAFAFADLPVEAITGQTKQAFANGFLGIGDFGRSTFATVGEATSADAAAIVAALARHFVEVYGAPDLATAADAAREELSFIADLCRELAINTVLTVRRTHDASGAIKEEFRTIKPPAGAPAHARLWMTETE
jgi:hypothetical protein